MEGGTRVTSRWAATRGAGFSARASGCVCSAVARGGRPRLSTPSGMGVGELGSCARLMTHSRGAAKGCGALATAAAQAMASTRARKAVAPRQCPSAARGESPTQSKLSSQIGGGDDLPQLGKEYHLALDYSHTKIGNRICFAFTFLHPLCEVLRGIRRKSEKGWPRTLGPHPCHWGHCHWARPRIF